MEGFGPKKPTGLDLIALAVGQKHPELLEERSPSGVCTLLTLYGPPRRKDLSKEKKSEEDGVGGDYGMGFSVRRRRRREGGGERGHFGRDKR